MFGHFSRALVQCVRLWLARGELFSLGKPSLPCHDNEVVMLMRAHRSMPARTTRTGLSTSTSRPQLSARHPRGSSRLAGAASSSICLAAGRTLWQTWSGLRHARCQPPLSRLCRGSICRQVQLFRQRYVGPREWRHYWVQAPRQLHEQPVCQYTLRGYRCARTRKNHPKLPSLLRHSAGSHKMHWTSAPIAVLPGHNHLWLANSILRAPNR